MIANSYKVQTFLYRVGLRTHPPGEGPEALLLYAGWQSLIPYRSRWVNPRDPFVHFLRWPLEYRVYLPLLCELTPTGVVLELGCHHGRTMLGLVDYLTPPGRYEGLDIMPDAIDFAQQHIQSRYPHCRFTLADVHNAVYHPAGRMKPEDYEFPYEDASFDVIYSASLFTHLTPRAAANYLHQSRRVLHAGGRCLISVFGLDSYDPSRGPRYQFPHALEPGVAVHDKKNPEDCIAYSRARLTEMAGEAGFAIERIVPGYWSGGDRLSVNEQDLALLRAT